ncbi:hypothetical protein SAMN05216360_103120 [Methylobacterium phyllostachyos]|uniref:Uncharacterized protein n=1 Tax=Methylobacterium phyllostachyos TaxID=582672 RepID=A0A1G9VA24_9HYPH|nr:hypothetical protein [Methylobacterium phyllostachyos]SDM69011.1 hypothetical protein SAMN05216360_103120 [Methylobacterium phyllostachyos]
MRPTDDLAGRLRWLDKVATHARGLPDVPAPRAALLQAIIEWARSHDHGTQVLPREGTRPADTIDRELRALQEYVEQDRRARQQYSDLPQNTRADGSGEPVGPDWPFYE